MHSEQRQILAQFHQTAALGAPNSFAHSLAELGASVEVVSALRTYFDKLADVAPPVIEDDANIVAQSYNQTLNNEAAQAGDPVSAILGAAMESAAASSQMDAMNQFALSNCHHSI